MIPCCFFFIVGLYFRPLVWYSVLSATNALAGAFGGLLAYAIQKGLAGHNGWSAWRCIFLIEGMLPVGWSIVIFLLLPSTPNSIRRGFSQNEKTVLLQRAASAHNTGDNKVVPKLILQVLMDPQFWLIDFIQSGMLLCSTQTCPRYVPVRTGGSVGI
jgi:sugar phosphate permease